MNTKWALAALSALLLLPAASAVSITVTSEGTTTISPGGSGAIDFTVSAECQEFVMGADPTDPTGFGSITVTVDSSDLPSWLTGTATEVSLSGADCITGMGTAPTATGSYALAAAADAPGMAPANITLTADDGSASALVQADYVPGYMFMVDGSFPLEVDGDGAEFGATIQLTSNARTMVMFEILEKPAYVTVSGFPGGNFKTVDDDDLAGALTYSEDLTFTVTPPTGAWTEDKLVFKTWSHFLDDGTLKTDDETFEWTFTNVAGASGGDESNDSPGAGLLAALALVGAAAFVARRR